MAKRAKQSWNKTTLRLKDDHSWQATPGYQLFVADRGALRLNFPEGWLIVPEADQINMHDRPPPDDDCRLAVSYLRLPMTVDWRTLPLRDLIRAAVAGDERPILSQGEVVTVAREDLELAWIEQHFIDPATGRPAVSRLSIGRKPPVQSLVTFDYWLDDKAKLEPVWDEVMRSLVLARFVDDPTQGDVVN